MIFYKKKKSRLNIKDLILEYNNNIFNDKYL